MAFLHPFIVQAIAGVGLGAFLAWTLTKIVPSLSASARTAIWGAPLWAIPVLYGLYLLRRWWIDCLAASGLADGPLGVVWTQLCRMALTVGPFLAPFFLLAGAAGMVKAAIGLWLARRLVAGSRMDADERRRIDQATASLAGAAAGGGSGPVWRRSLERTRVVIASRGLGQAFTIGLWRPVVVLSRTFLKQLDDDELAAVLAHEFSHIVAGDHWRKWLAVLLRDALFFTGLSFMVFRRLQSSMELAADARAVELAGRPLALASSLIKSWRLEGAEKRRPLVLDGFATGLAQAEVTLRVERLTSAGRPSPAPASGSGSPPRAGLPWAVPAVWFLMALVSLALC